MEIIRFSRVTITAFHFSEMMNHFKQERSSYWFYDIPFREAKRYVSNGSAKRNLFISSVTIQDCFIASPLAVTRGLHEPDLRLQTSDS